MPEQLHVLLADDDTDDRFFFDKALKVLPVSLRFTAVEDGARLMEYLQQNLNNLPDVLFLDLNMPRMNGSECLEEIKGNKKLQKLPVIIYSTSLHEDLADELYKNGAHYYIRKAGLDELESTLLKVLNLLKKEKFSKPPRNKFVLSMLAL